MLRLRRLKERFLLPVSRSRSEGGARGRPGRAERAGPRRGDRRAQRPARDRVSPEGASVIRPRALRPGDLVGVCAPCGSRRPRAARAGRGRRSKGWASAFASPRAPWDGSSSPSGPAGAGARRARRPLRRSDEVAAIVCARGGAGAGGAAASARPRPPAAPSQALRGLQRRHLPAPLPRPARPRERPRPDGRRASSPRAPTTSRASATPSPARARPARASPDDLVALRAGEGEGVLRGGCLSILAAAAGTPWALRARPRRHAALPRGRGRAAVPHRPHAAAASPVGRLRRACAASCSATCRGCAPTLDEDYTLEDVILEALDGLDVPIALGPLERPHQRTPP